MKVLNRIPLETQNIQGAKMFPEERLGFIEQFENNGLYPKLSTDAIKSQIRFYQMGSAIIPGDSNFYNTNLWWQFIYKIPRRW
jgi:hypothetical protein